MTPPRSERGAALLTVLLLVAVMATIAATALDRLSLATRLAGNAVTLGQARAWLGTAELLATTRLEDLVAASPGETTLAGGWMGIERTIALPDGASVRATVRDGGNCFNLNSLVEATPDGMLVARPRAGEQFAALMVLLGIGSGEALGVAGATTDFIDSDSVVGPAGGEDGAYGGRDAALPANRLLADKSELRAVAGVTPRIYATLDPWICALPVAELSPINVNTLLPEQSLLLAMLASTQLTPALARAQLAGRPQGGYGSVYRFWASPILASLKLPSEVTAQTQVRTTWFTLSASVAAGGLDVTEAALIDARQAPAVVVRRQWGETR
ncbi:general secretion pathway protein GspK [Sphingorhabdus soli]|uniref:Type II secretion system protein K n=1 Tax=Flavisphingopyxis soli TaxID=2601267 RepID=A0A5C6UUH2_9SPHN|nr:type II secretion system minor pseudopilin GspK [Sphingorhabdus soli]TXC74335.1 general secretion pathway protein GspK [Sphingorhabdus soli]